MPCLSLPPQLLNGGGRTAFEFSSAFLDQCGHRAAPLASTMAARPKSARPPGAVLVVRPHSCLQAPSDSLGELPHLLL